MSTTSTPNSYASAKKQLESNKRLNISNLVTWDAGDGFVGRGYWCSTRQRIITEVITPSGHIIH